MRISGIKLERCPILSIHVAGKIGEVAKVVIDPNDLSVPALLVKSLVAEAGEVLLTREIREVANIGIIIDSNDALVNREDLIKMQEIINLNYNIIGAKVKTKRGATLGRVKDFIIEAEDFRIVQIVVKRTALKALLDDDELLISKSQIIEVTDTKIIVKDAAERKSAEELFVPNFVNPFREKPAPRQTAPLRKKNLDEVDSE